MKKYLHKCFDVVCMQKIEKDRINLLFDHLRLWY
jgi:hypothetical protein